MVCRSFAADSRLTRAMNMGLDDVGLKSEGKETDQRDDEPRPYPTKESVPTRHLIPSFLNYVKKNSSNQPRGY